MEVFGNAEVNSESLKPEMVKCDSPGSNPEGGEEDGWELSMFSEAFRIELIFNHMHVSHWQKI